MQTDGKAYESAISINSKIQHHDSMHYCTHQIQSTNIIKDDWIGELQISAIYSPPKHVIKKEDHEIFIKNLGSRLLAGGDYNGKHIH